MRQHTDSSLCFGTQRTCQKMEPISINYIVFILAVTAEDDFADI